MNTASFQLLLADDDMDDCMLFKEALEELPVTAALKTVNDGDILMHLLETESPLPDILFLDLNMPRKTGFECLTEIKQNPTLKSLPIIIYSTALDHEAVNMLYEKGANHYIRKPGDFAKLKRAILEALTLIPQNEYPQPTQEHFIIQV